jgi:hypothetical protein
MLKNQVKEEEMDFKTTALLIIGMQKDVKNILSSMVTIVPSIKIALDISRKKMHAYYLYYQSSS